MILNFIETDQGPMAFKFFLLQKTKVFLPKTAITKLLPSFSKA